MTPEEVAENLIFELPGWDIVEVSQHDQSVVVTCENEYGDGMVFRVAITDLSFEPGPPRKEDFEPDRIEPGEGESPW